MKILNLYAGIGGNREKWAGHEVTAVEYDPAIASVYEKRFPQDKMIVGDAHQYLERESFRDSILYGHLRRVLATGNTVIM